MEHRTSLVIAHRLSTIQHAHEILVIHEGQIAERGSHDQLNNLNGIYKKLSDIQKTE
jgi:subfamily B ATP-binding cassette protein MsbA